MSASLHRFGPQIPAESGFAITPNDLADLPAVTRYLLVGVAGDVKVDMAEGSTALVLKLPAGIHALRVRRVHATATTAASLVGLV